MLLSRIKDAIDYIRLQTQLKPKIGITLGSGLSRFADEIDIECSIPYTDIPHFVPPSIDGHPGQLVLGKIGDTPVVVLQGRVHFYEGHSMNQVVFPTRVLAQMGIETLILTNAAGGIDPQMRAGDFMIITDHINLTGNNPLIGPNIQELGLRFPDMSEAYDRELNGKLTRLLTQLKIRHFMGVYCGVSGPTYETSAEVQFLQKIGGSAVGMSTVPETIAAKHMGLRVCGISCITNLATGISTGKVTHEEVKETAKKVQETFIHFLKEFVKH